MAYLMKFKKRVASVVGDEIDKDHPDDPSKRFFAKGKTYAIQPNDAVHFLQSEQAEFAFKGKKER